jgi:hypothetical protein
VRAALGKAVTFALSGVPEVGDALTLYEEPESLDDLPRRELVCLVERVRESSLMRGTVQLDLRVAHGVAA